MSNNQDIKKDFLYERIADKLEEDIINNCFPDMKLPTEQELCLRYSASRTAVREALKVLGERRLITSVVGSGAYITRPEANDLSAVISRLINTHHIDMTDVIDLRIILETNAACFAALNATAEDFEALNSISELLSDPNCPVGERVELDNKFHIKLCEASHNNILTLLASSINSIVRGFINTAMAGDSNSPDLIRHVSHSRILDAVRSGNPIAAQSIVYDHLYTTRIIYENSISKKQ